MTAKNVLTIGFGAARIAIGVVAMAYPEKIGRTWIGDSADEDPTKVILRGLGARDIALGAGTIEAVLNDRDVTAWLGFSAFADLTDLTATLIGGKSLPKNGVLVTSALAGAGALTGAALAAAELSED